MIENTLTAFFSNYSKKSLLIAYSGGIDSQVLLHCLASLKQQQLINTDIRVCHINHGLSKNAQKWQKFAKAQCLQLNFPLEIIAVNVQAQPQKSLEALARDARYNALKSVAQQNDLIVTGHHIDDQAETFLLALKRGSGLKGLSAMQSEIKFGQQCLVRPLLNISRADIEAYAKAHQLIWIEDESNNDDRFDRNFLRHQIFPLLNERWSSFNKTLARSADHCLEAQQLLDELAEQDLAICSANSVSTLANTLKVSALLELSQARLNNLLRYFLSLHQVLMPSSQQLQQICWQLSAEIDKSPVVQLADCCLRRFKGELYLTPIYQDISLWQQQVNIGDLVNDKRLNLNLPDNLARLTFVMQKQSSQQSNHGQTIVKPPLLGQVVSIRFSHQNPKCLPEYRQHSRTLKKVLQELSIPPWQRKRLPFLYYDDELVAVVGQFVCKEYLAFSDKLALSLLW
jgi:tRNA(Ile)-lysidine synthase